MTQRTNYPHVGLPTDRILSFYFKDQEFLSDFSCSFTPDIVLMWQLIGCLR